jgi:hypothetical protein
MWNIINKDNKWNTIEELNNIRIDLILNGIYSNVESSELYYEITRMINYLSNDFEVFSQKDRNKTNIKLKNLYNKILEFKLSH